MGDKTIFSKEGEQAIEKIVKDVFEKMRSMKPGKHNWKGNIELKLAEGLFDVEKEEDMPLFKLKFDVTYTKEE